MVAVMMKKILIVDDEVSTRSALRRMLQLSDYDIVEAADGREALERFANEPIDIVLTDILMPEMDGLEFIQTLQERYEDVKIIVMSGVFEIEGIYINCLDHARRIGVDIVLEKPFSEEELHGAIHQLLGQ